MENEAELGKGQSEHTDDGFSEKKLAINIDRNARTQQVPQGGNIFAPQKTNKTVFQAQKSEEK